MIYEPELHNDQVSSFLEMMLQSATQVDRPLTEKDALIIFVGTLSTGRAKAEARIAELEARLEAHTTQKKKH